MKNQTSMKLIFPNVRSAVRCALLCVLGVVFALPTAARNKKQPLSVDDRALWVNALCQMAEPVLRPLSEGKLSETMKLELAPSWDGRDVRVGYLECFGRLMDGITPWLALPDDNTDEGRKRRELRTLALKACAQAVNPESDDYMLWHKENQPLVDAAFLAQSFLRAWDGFWMKLDTVTQARYIEVFRGMRRVTPSYSNWLLFSATVETFLVKAGVGCDQFRITIPLRKMEEWYVGDGMYSDGPHFAMDYYNAFVIQPMYVEVLDVLSGMKRASRKQYEKALERMQRYAVLQERFISPEGTFPVFGRSITYRSAALQPLSMLALRHQLPASLKPGQVRAALTAVYRRMWGDNRNYNADGYLTLGFNGHQPDISDYYTNNGSLYMAAVGFVALGLPADDPFWTDAPLPWTSKKAWEGDPFPKDHAY